MLGWWAWRWWGSLWGLVEAQGGVLLACWHPGPGYWLWCCCALLLWTLLQGHKSLNRESPLSHLATSFLLLSAEGDLVSGEEQTCEHILPLDRDWTVPIALHGPALTSHWPSSLGSLAINWAWHLWGSTLGGTSYCPLYTHSTTSRISCLVDPKRVLKQMLDNKRPNLRALRSKCELHYQVPALWSIPLKTKPQQWAVQTRGPQQEVSTGQTPAPSSI